MHNDISRTLAARLRAETQGEVLFAPADRGRYATDASVYQQMPIGVLVPRTQADVRTALAVCRDLKVPIVPRGGGTSQCGQTVGAGLVIDHSKHLRKLLRVDAAEREAEVEPGIVLDHLNAQLKNHGLWYPVDVSTSAQATLGGMAGNNSCGSRSIAYGNMVHNVLGARALLADGSNLELGRFDRASGAARQLGERVQALAAEHRVEIEGRWPKVMRRVAGYNLDIFHPQSERPYTTDGSVNLAHLLIGSEGTLALTESLTLRLSELPRSKVLGVVNFGSFHQAMDSAQHIVALGNTSASSLTAVELVDRTMIQLALQNPAFAPTMRKALIGDPAAILLVEFSGTHQADLLPRLQDLVQLMGDIGLPGSVVEMPAEPAQKALWEVRKAGLNIMMSLKGDGKPVSFIEDCAVPLKHLAEYTDALTQVFARHGTRGTWYAHASVGTLHVRPILDMRKDGAAKMRAIADEASALVRRYKGAYSGEHGDGLCRGEWIEWQFGPRIHQAFVDIKRLMDPQGLLCPQRMVDPPKMDDTTLMRFAPGYKIIPIQTALDWSSWNVQADAVTERTSAPGTGGDPAQGFGKAVEMCNNNGHCRKFDSGTMCPSYRVTRDEQHLTRGRANTLRLALSGQLEGLQAQDAMSSAEVKAALDLCVGCKGCKRDCPTGVDMARMKIEFLHHYTTRHGHTWRERLVAHLPAYARWAGWLAPLLNLRDRVPGLATLSEKWVGLSARRSLPKWHRRHHFNSETAQDLAKQPPGDGKSVLLFVDTFTGHLEPGVVHDAITVLKRAGYRPQTATPSGLGPPRGGHLCCGRTYLATGMLAEAKEKASELVDALHPFAVQGIPIVGLEPSCLLTLRDEALVMGLGDKAQVVAAQSMLFEEFLAREAKAGALQALSQQLQPAKQPILLHGHCHQKAFDAVNPILDVIRLIPQAQPQLIETSCCGMAGSFGYDAEHFDVSMQMAELSLLPAVRSQPDAIVVADGTSCRHQIHDGAQRQAIHAATLLARCLTP